MKRILTYNSNIITAGGSILNRNINNELLYVLELNETSGTTAYDATGRNNDFTIGSSFINYTYEANGKIGGCYRMKFNTQYFSKSFTNQTNGKFEFTTGFWLNPLGVANHRRVFILRNSNNPSIRFNINHTNDNQIAVNIVRSSGDVNYVSPDILLNLNGWNHIVASIKELTPLTFTLNIYVNGQKSTSNIEAVETGWISPLKLNQIKYNDPETLSEYLIDQPFFTKTILTDSEIAKLYNNGNGLPYSQW